MYNLHTIKSNNFKHQIWWGLIKYDHYSHDMLLLHKKPPLATHSWSHKGQNVWPGPLLSGLLPASLALPITAGLHQSLIPQKRISWFLAQLLQLHLCSCLYPACSVPVTSQFFSFWLSAFLKPHFLMQSGLQWLLTSLSDLLYHGLAFNFATFIKIPGGFNGVVGHL